MPEIEKSIKRQLDRIQGTYEPWLDGQELERGYKPDRVYKYRGTLLIIEAEATTNRKTFLGSYVKAHKYFDRESARGRILLIMKVRDNTKLDSIYDQLSPYHEWITGMNAKNIHVQIITMEQLDFAKRKKICLFSPEFKCLGETLK